MSNVIINSKISFIPTSINVESEEITYVLTSATGTRKFRWGYGKDYPKARMVKGGSGSVKLSDEETQKLTFMLVCAIKAWRNGTEEGADADMRTFAEKSFTITRRELSEFVLPKQEGMNDSDDTQYGVIPF